MELTKKAYWVGTNEHLSELHMPECAAELILADIDAPVSKVKQMMIFGYEYPFIDLRAKRAPELDLYNYDGRELTKQHIYDIEETIKWRREMANFVSDNAGAKVYIYSNEHGAWWRGGGAGYCTSKDAAGVYDISDAWSRIHHVDHKKGITLHLLNQ